MRRALMTSAAALCLALTANGCSDKQTADSAAGQTPAATATAGEKTAADARPSPAAAPTKCDSYTDDLGDRDWAIIYYATTGLSPPREKWADEALSGLDRGLGAEEAWKRANAQVDTQWNAVKDIRCVTLRTRADPKEYDPGLGGIPLGAFAPDAFFPFRDGSMQIALKFRNADKARVWKMTADKAAALKADSWLGNLGLVIRARLVASRPSGNGGTIETEVVGFDIEPSEYSRIDRETVTVTP
jgi:hypothetical protein